MELTEATRTLLEQTAGHAELRQQTQALHDDIAAGHKVTPQVLLAVLGEAADAGVLSAHQRDDPLTHHAMTTALITEIDRLAPVG